MAEVSQPSLTAAAQRRRLAAGRGERRRGLLDSLADSDAGPIVLRPARDEHRVPPLLVIRHALDGRIAVSGPIHESESP